MSILAEGKVRNIEPRVIDPAKVMLVYSGKPGCMCGCRGSYRVNPIYRAEADKSRGYAYDDKEINLTQVKRVVGILNAHKATVESYNDSVFLELDGRVYAAYFPEVQ